MDQFTQSGILAIVVLYKRSPGDSPSFRTLLEAAQVAPSVRLSVVLADNAPGAEGPGVLPDGVRYVSYPDNPGLARPYNEALAMAEQEGYTWLLTLDQDTHLPTNFLAEMQKYADRYGGDERVSTIAPRIFDQGRLISPLRFVGGFLPCVLPRNARGLSKRFTSALNSTSLHRVSAIRSIGGYDARFALHNSDTDLFHRLDEAGLRTVVVPDISVTHELAIMQRADRMSPERYRHMLLDECAYWDLNMGVLGRAERFIRLIGRFAKGTLRGEDSAFLAVTRDEMKRRLFTTRRQRIATSVEAFAESGKAPCT